MVLPGKPVKIVFFGSIPQSYIFLLGRKIIFFGSPGLFPGEEQWKQSCSLNKWDAIYSSIGVNFGDDNPQATSIFKTKITHINHTFITSYPQKWILHPQKHRVHYVWSSLSVVLWRSGCQKQKFEKFVKYWPLSKTMMRVQLLDWTSINPKLLLFII